MRLPLMWVSLAFIAGILLAKLVSLPLFLWLIFTILAITAAIFLRRSTFILPAACLIAIFTGAARYQATVPILPSHKSRGSTTGITTFSSPAHWWSLQTLAIRIPICVCSVEQVDTGTDQFKVGGLLLARVQANQTYHYGDIVRVRGRLQTPPEDEDFSYREYLAREGIRSYMPSADATLLPGSEGNPIVAAIYTLKEKSLDNIYRLFPDPEASLLAGILLGVDSGLSEPLQQAFKNTGTAHIIAISGFNIAIIAGIFVKLFSRILGTRRGAAAAIVGIAFYTFLVGANAAVVRAAIMGTISLFAVQVGRRQQGLNTLAFVAGLMALINPLVLWDVGFQLSFFATLGLVLYGDTFQQAAEKLIARFFPSSNAEKFSELFAEFILLTFAAQLTTLPIMAYQFKQISLISFAANPFILPAQPAVMILGGQAVFASLLYFPLGQLIAWAAWPLTAYTIRMVELFNAVPHGVIYLGGFSLGFVVLYYGVLLSITFAGSSIKSWLSSLRGRSSLSF
jgi:competence protein ComEC